MHDDRAFLDAIREHPDDDLHRLAWADWLEENGQTDRAAFVRAQLRLAALDEADPASDALEDEADDLLAAHEAQWLGPIAGLCQAWRWRRGCVEHVTTWSDTLLADGAALFALAPVCGLRLLAEAQDLPRLAARPLLTRLQELQLSAGVQPDRGVAGPYHRDRELQALLVSPHLRGLTRLDLSGQGIEGPVIATLIDTGILANLTHLDLSACHALGDAGIALLRGARADRLEYLGLLGVNLTPAGLRELLASDPWPALRRVNLSRVQLPTGGAAALGLAELLQAPLLRRSAALNLSQRTLGRPSIEALCTAPDLMRLEALELSGCGLGPEAAEGLAGCAGLANLRRLELGHNHISDRGARALANSPHLGRLTRLGLAGNRIGGPGLRALLGSPTLAGLRDLDLAGNFVGPTGAEALAERPRRLVRLDLSRANLAAAAARLLARSPALDRLRVLRLGDNRLGADGVQALAQSPHLRRLRELSLDDNDVTSAAAQALFESPHLSRVQTLSLRNAYITALERERLRVRFGDATVF